MNRRNFIATSASAAVLATVASRAQASDAALPPVNLIYTKENPGAWDAKKATHAPLVEVAAGKVKIITPHPMSEEHFIVRHTLVLANGTVVGAKTFTPKDQPISEYTLPAGYSGKIFATSFCNQHDFWLTEAKV